MLVEASAIADSLVCPMCGAALVLRSDRTSLCPAPVCPSGGSYYPQVDGKPVLVDFANSVLEREVTLATAGASVITRHGGFMTGLFRLITGVNPITPRYATEILAACQLLAEPEGRRPRVLIVGGGTIGDGADALYEAQHVDLISMDIYASPFVTMVADGHALPLAEASVDGVWIQAVLEHVLDPAQVVAEIVRVLRPAGVVFADTPFLWPVHEKAWDFTRWTASGHRWLFRRFAVIAAGRSSGPGTVSLLALRYLASSLFRSTKMGQLLTLPFIWLRLLDRLCDDRKGLDAAGGLFFYGRKTSASVPLKAIIPFYDEQIALEEAERQRG
jgi:SAM-dependent methyltransferase